MAKTYELTASEIPERRSQSLYADIIVDFVAQGAQTMQVTIEGMKPATLRAGLRTLIERMSAEEVGLARRGEETFLVRQPGR